MTINVPSQIGVFKPIVAESQVEANIYLWQLKKVTEANSEVPATKIAINNNKTLHIWAEPGKYDLGLIAIVVDWEKKEITYNEYLSQFEVIVQTESVDNKVKSLLSKMDATALVKKDQAVIVYNNVATEAENRPTAWTVDMMLSESRLRSSVIEGVGNLWESFWLDLVLILKNSGLTDVVGYIKAFRSVASIIEAY